MNDLISRKAVIDKAITIPIAKIVTEDKVIYRRIVFVEDIENLPSAQSEKISCKKPEVICCKDCRYRDPEDKKCNHGHGIVWQLPRPDDWFCADGKA